MSEIAEIIVQYVSIWAPSLVAILGIVATIVGALKKVKDAVSTLKSDATIKSLGSEVHRLTQENEELLKCYKLLLDNITKIKDYTDHKGV